MARSSDRRSAAAARGQLPEREESLWWLVASPLLWAAHFLVSYVAAAVYCARSGPDADLLAVRILIAATGALALAAIAATGWLGWRRHGRGSETVPHDFDNPAGRHGFLGFATALLSGLSAVAVLYESLAAWFIRSCH